jgi:peptidoglycan-associated lipoprotein
MKINRLIFPLAIALATMVAATGCKHGITGMTKLPMGQRNYPGGETGPTTKIPDGQLINTPEVPPTYVQGPIGTTTNWNPADMIQDRTTLAANTVHFKLDSAVILDKEQANVAAVAQFLTGDAAAFLLIEGHCDERGTEEYNRTLGERRALGLREALVKANVSANRIRTISYGKDKPADTAHNEAAWSKNRRGEFIVCRPK